MQLTEFSFVMKRTAFSMLKIRSYRMLRITCIQILIKKHPQILPSYRKVRKYVGIDQHMPNIPRDCSWRRSKESGMEMPSGPW